MLKDLDLTLKVNKNDYQELLPDLQNRLYSLQKAAWEADIPCMIVFEGWEVAGKGTVSRKLTGPLDPRGFKFHTIREATSGEKRQPWMQRFWLLLPAKGEWAIFYRSWYRRVLDERQDGSLSENDWRKAYRDIVDFERTLHEAGHLIIKLFLHITKQEQRKRLEQRNANRFALQKPAGKEWEQHHQYGEWLQAYEEMFHHTDTEWGSWNMIPATNWRHAVIETFTVIIEALEAQLDIYNRISTAAILAQPLLANPSERPENVEEADSGASEAVPGPAIASEPAHSPDGAGTAQIQDESSPTAGGKPVSEGKMDPTDRPPEVSQ